MTDHPLSNPLIIAYNAVTMYTEKTLAATAELESKKADLERLILLAKASGTITGKNDGEREAAALSMFPQQFADVDKCKTLYRDYANMLAVAKIELDKLRDLLRIEELVSQTAFTSAIHPAANIAVGATTDINLTA